jgi:hypothetical protein
VAGQSAATEVALEQIHQLLVEVKDYLEDKDTKKSLKLCGKVELVLENWNDDAFFGDEEVDPDPDTDDDYQHDEDELEDDDGSFLEDDEDESDDGDS